MIGEQNEIFLTKTAYEHLVVAVGKMLEEGKKAGQQLAVLKYGRARYDRII